MGLFGKKKKAVKEEVPAVEEKKEELSFDDDEFEATAEPDKIDEESNLEVEDTKKKDSNDNEEKEKDYVLYIIIDRKNPELLKYLRQLGINVSKIFTSIPDAKDSLLMQVEPSKIVIVDTGTGRFSTMSQRKEILDLMGIADEDAMISVYQTDSVLKSEVKYMESLDNKDIHWHKYRSTADVAAHLLQNKGRENYIFDKEDMDEIEEIPENILDYKGFKFEEPKHLEINMGSSSLSIRDIHNNMVFNEDKEKELESYVPRY